MKKITKQDWLTYKDKLSQINQKATDELTHWIDYHGGVGEADRDDLIAYAYALITKYGEASGAYTAQYYDDMARLSNVTVPPAEVAELPSYGEVAKAINGTIKHSSKSSYVAGAAGRLVKRVSADTLQKNALRDGAEWAWVPAGDTCSYCLMLASNGWQRASKKLLKDGHADHIHENCDCTFAVRFDSDTDVEGYEPEKYQKAYQDAEGDTPQEKINSMRRMQYQANPEKYRAQERENYAKHDTERKMLRLAKQGNTFVTKADPLFEYAKKIKPYENYEDIVGHGDPISMVFKNLDGKESNVSAEEFADILEKGGIYKGGKIRLIACQTGAGDAIVPTYLAKRFNTIVMAPTEIVNVDFDGKIILADNEEDAKMGIETGIWAFFGPNGRIS